MSRRYGLLADHVTSAKVIDARGQLLTADSSTNPELFFAVRGGGGGTYGIVVEATLRIVEVPVVTLGHIVYKGLNTAVALLDRWVRYHGGREERGPRSSCEASWQPGSQRTGRCVSNVSDVARQAIGIVL